MKLRRVQWLLSQPVFHSLEVGQGFADIFFPDAKARLAENAGG